MNEVQTKLIETTPEGQFDFLEKNLWAWDPFPQFRSYSVLRFLERDRIILVRALKADKVQDTLRAVAKSLRNDVCEGVSEEAPTSWLEVEAPRKWSGLGIGHPSLAQGSALARDTEWAVPHIWFAFLAERCEIGINESADEALARERVFRATDSQRAVSPFTKVRSFFAKSKQRSGGAGKTRGIAKWPNVLRSFGTLAEDDGFLEIENYEREVARFDHEAGYTLSFREEEHELSPKAAESWLNTFAKEGADAAAKELT